eukprot:789410_1
MKKYKIVMLLLCVAFVGGNAQNDSTDAISIDLGPIDDGSVCISPFICKLNEKCVVENPDDITTRTEKCVCKKGFNTDEECNDKTDAIDDGSDMSWLDDFNFDDAELDALPEVNSKQGDVEVEVLNLDADGQDNSDAPEEENSEQDNVDGEDSELDGTDGD